MCIQPTRIFILGTAVDCAERDRLEIHLSPLCRSGQAEIWHEGKVQPGLMASEEVQRQFLRAEIIILLVSADFLASDECDEHMRAAIKRQQAGESRIVPILLSPTTTVGTPLANLAFLPSGGKPISDWPSSESAWHDAVQQIRHLVVTSGSLQTGTTPSNAAAMAGDHSPLLRLAEFEALIEERTRSFVGRSHLIGAIEEILNDPAFPSGYVVIWGEPGIGKTALACRLIKEHGWIHHFNISAQDIRSTGSFLANVCSQLIARYVPAAGPLVPEAIISPRVLNRLLAEAARVAQHPLVVVVDALDESDATEIPPSANPLLLPSSLPEKIYFLLTSRGRPDLYADRRRDLHMGDTDPQNLSDVTTFIEEGIAAHVELLHRWSTDLRSVVETLVAKSEGNFMYVTLVWRDLIERRLTPDRVGSLSALPQGLRDYYRRHWREMGLSRADFDRCGKQVICLLASARESITANELASWSKGLDLFEVRQTLHEWRHFLQEGSSDGKTTYRLYHGSFRDFLREEIGLESFSPQIADALWRQVGLT